MATSIEYLEFVLEQLKEEPNIRYRKMFGEYMIYCNEKPILTVCDNTVYVKKYPELDSLMQGSDSGCPYEGAKEHWILDTENRELIRALIPILEKVTPMPKPKVKKSQKKAEKDLPQ